MKKLYSCIIFILTINLVQAQWTKINAIPSSDIVVLAVNNNTMYAATPKNIIYKSNDAVVWDPMIVSPAAINITALAFYNNKIYAGTSKNGVFFSSNNGETWQNSGNNPPEMSGFAVRNNVLYASTLGFGMYVLNPVTNTWSPFSNALPSYSVNVQGMIGSPDLIAAAGANGTYYRYNFNNNSWNEEFYDGMLHPGLLINNIINNGDTIFAVSFNRVIRSNDAGATWVNDRIGTHTGVYRDMFAGTDNYYMLTNVIPNGGGFLGTWIQQRDKHVAAGNTWATDEEFLPNGFAYDIIEFNNKLFLAKADGLYVKTIAAGGPVPVQFLLFNSKCGDKRVVLTWKTAQENNSRRFDVEKSTDGNSWTVIGNVAAAGNSSDERTYSFTDNNTVPNSFYRIAEYDVDGRVQYTSLLRSSCSVTESFSILSNPVRDVMVINVTAAVNSQATVRVFDSKAALVKTQKVNIIPGNNQLSIDVRSLASGVYQLSIDWNNGKERKTERIIKL